ncbi:hypothetical protein FRC07_007773 [Ceratobasidium sp. 392]|nr:hypothetical protein FRC07_007773 [Ceratobasidium sp. 392]
MVLEDGSSYRLRRQTPSNASEVTSSQDIVERISSMDLLSQRLITVTFTPDFYADLMLVLKVCYSVRCVSEKLQASNDDKFFAYALLFNMIRHPLPPSAMNNKHETALEALWKDVYHFVHNREPGFQEQTIANQTQTTLLRLLRIATEERATMLQQGPVNQTAHIKLAMAWVEASARRDDTLQLSEWDRAWDLQWNQSWTNRWCEKWSSVSSSHSTSSLCVKTVIKPIISGPVTDGRISGQLAGRALIPAQRVATTSTTPEPVPEPVPEPILGSPRKRQGLFVELLAKFKRSTTQNQIDPVASDDFQMVALGHNDRQTHALSGNADSAPSASAYQNFTFHPTNCPIRIATFECAVELGWRAAWESSFAKGGRAAQHLRTQEGETAEASGVSAASQPGGALDTKRFLEILQRLLYVPLRRGVISKTTQPDKQLSTPQAPSTGLGETQVEQGAPVRSGLEVSLNNRQNEQQVNKQPQAENQENISVRNKVVARIQELLLSHPDSRRNLYQAWRDQEAAKSEDRRKRDRIRRNAVESAKAKEDPLWDDLKQQELDQRASEAWAHVMGTADVAEPKLKAIAEQEWKTKAAQPFTAIALGLMSKQNRFQVIAAWEEAFKRTWKAVWKDSWKAAWRATWKHGWKEAEAKGIDFGVEDYLKDVPVEEEKSLMNLKSYKGVKSVIEKEETYLGTLSQMNSLCKELNQLHSALQNSIPTPHEHVMEIKTHEAWNIRLGREGATERLSGPRTVSHSELQGMIEEQKKDPLSTSKLSQKALMQGMAEVWERTLQISSKVGRVKSPAEA